MKNNKKLNKTAAFLVNNLAAENDNNKHAYITKGKWINRRETDYEVKRVIKLDAQNQGQDSTETNIIGLINKCMCIMITSDFQLL